MFSVNAVLDCEVIAINWLVGSRSTLREYSLATSRVMLRETAWFAAHPELRDAFAELTGGLYARQRKVRIARS